MSDGNLCLVLSEDGESQGNEAQAPSTHAGAVVFHLSKLTADQFTVKEANKPVQCQVAAFALPLSRVSLHVLHASSVSLSSSISMLDGSLFFLFVFASPTAE